ATADLFIDKQGIDDPPAVLDHPVFEDLDESGLGIEFDLAALDSVGEGERIALWRKVMRYRQLRLCAGRQPIRAEVGYAGNLGQLDTLHCRSSIDDPAALDVQIRGAFLQNGASDRE